jgi:hypothetical protein
MDMSSSNLNKIDGSLQYDLEAIQLSKNSDDPEVKRSQKLIEKIKAKTLAKVLERKRVENEERAKKLREEAEAEKHARLENNRSNILQLIEQNKKNYQLIKKSDVICPKCSIDLSDSILKKSAYIVPMWYNKEGQLICSVCNCRIEKQFIF